MCFNTCACLCVLASARLLASVRVNERACGPRPALLAVDAFLPSPALSRIQCLPDASPFLAGGSSPPDLDSYLLLPAPPAGGDECLISYRSRKCFQDSIKYTHLDLDATSHSRRGGLPETITIGYLSTGKYVFWAKEYQGVNEQGLLNSGAVATFYAEGFQERFRVGRDGYLQGPTWYVFWLDGATKEIKPCDPDTCPPR